MRRAGKTIRAMAWDYKKQGAYSWALAASSIVSTVGLPVLLKFSLAVPLYLVGLGAGLVFFLRGRKLFRQAARADQGAEGEEEIAKILRQLPSGWKTEMNSPAASSGVSEIAGSDSLPFMISGRIADCVDLGLYAPRGEECTRRDSIAVCMALAMLM